MQILNIKHSPLICFCRRILSQQQKETETPVTSARNILQLLSHMFTNSSMVLTQPSSEGPTTARSSRVTETPLLLVSNIYVIFVSL